MEPRDKYGDSAFLSRQIRAQELEQQQQLAMPKPRKQKRRWFLTFLIGAILGGLLSSVDRGVSRAQSAFRGWFPNLFEDDQPTGPSFGIQKGKLKNEDEYRAFIDSLELDYISADEVIQPHRNIRNGIKNELPPKRYWGRIRETLKVADAVRKELGVPLQAINSAYRVQAYNKQCGGVSNSYHTRNLALDLVYACPPKQAARAAKKLREQGVFKGGIGVYSTFIHIDTRGKNANWGLPT